MTPAPKTTAGDGQQTLNLAPDTTGSLQIAINQVEYSNNPDGPIIHIFGRDTGGKAIHLEVTGFQPYFYAPVNQVDGKALPAQVTRVDEGTYTSIRGEELRRIFTARPTDVREVRDRFRHFEADIPFATRFMIDTGLTGGVVAPGSSPDYKDAKPAVVNAPARICIMDIECEDFRGFPDPGRDAIICLTCWDSFDDDYVTFVFSPDSQEEKLKTRLLQGGLGNGCFAEGKHKICSYKT